MSNQKASGTCHCGSVKYIVTGDIEAFYCHCNSCRLNSSAPYAAWGRVHSNSFQLVRGRLKAYNSSNNVVWYFCEKCGTGIKYENSESIPDIDFLLATLEVERCPAPTYHVQVREKLPWVQLNDKLPQYLRWRNS